MEGISRFAFAENLKYRQIPCWLLKIRNDFCPNFIPQFELLLDSSCNHKKCLKKKKKFQCQISWKRTNVTLPAPFTFPSHKVSQFSTSTINNTDVNLGSCKSISYRNAAFCQCQQNWRKLIQALVLFLSSVYQGSGLIFSKSLLTARYQPNKILHPTVLAVAPDDQ